LKYLKDSDIDRLDLKVPVELKVLLRDRAWMTKSGSLQEHCLSVLAKDAGRPDLAEAYTDLLARKRLRRKHGGGRKKREKL